VGVKWVWAAVKGVMIALGIWPRAGGAKLMWGANMLRSEAQRRLALAIELSLVERKKRNEINKGRVGDYVAQWRNKFSQKRNVRSMEIHSSWHQRPGCCATQVCVAGSSLWGWGAWFIRSSASTHQYP
jgi:hypothetical protein